MLGGGSDSIAVQIRNRIAILTRTCRHPMPSWPVPEGRRTITIDLPASHVEHLDAQAHYEGCSRVAYIRQLIRRDIERQGPTRAPARAKA